MKRWRKCGIATLLLAALCVPNGSASEQIAVQGETRTEQTESVTGDFSLVSVQNREDDIAIGYRMEDRSGAEFSLLCRKDDRSGEGYEVIDTISWKGGGWAPEPPGDDEVGTRYWMDRKAYNGTVYTYKLVHVYEDGHCTASCPVSMCRLVQPELRKAVSTKAGTFKLEWKTNSKSDGYEILYSEQKNMSNAKIKRIRSKTTGQKTISGLKSGKTYYVRYRSFRTVDGVVYYSAKSNRKRVTIA
ncbi:MAG: hypothetical protein ACI4PM_07025 [Butyricicoccus sp.]